MQALPTPGTLVAEKYRIEALLGEGGMGAVFRANHELMDKPVALKWLHPELTEHAEAKARFVREARAAARIRHPNVVDVYDVGTHGDALFLVMELLEGESFEALLGRGETPLSDALGLLIGAMHGVAAAHQRGIVHRDIKPENIFVEQDDTYPAGIAKVLDFGISKLADDRTGGRNVTQTGHTMGTPTYMSLEQINGARDIDHRADIYAFGVLLYRTLTGELPFDGPTFGAIAVQVATHTPPPPSQLRPALPSAIDAVVMRAMARDRTQRFDSIRGLLDALTSVGVESGLLTPRLAQPSLLTPSTPSLASRLDALRMPSSIPPAGPTAPAETTPSDVLVAPRLPTPAAPEPIPRLRTPATAMLVSPVPTATLDEAPEPLPSSPPPAREPTPAAAMPVPRSYDARGATPTKPLLAGLASPPIATDSASVAPAPAAATLPARRSKRPVPLLAAAIGAAVLGLGSLAFNGFDSTPEPAKSAPLRVAAPPPRLPTMPDPPPPLETTPTAVVPAPRDDTPTGLEAPAPTPEEDLAAPLAAPAPTPTEGDAASLAPATPRPSRPRPSVAPAADTSPVRSAAGRRSGRLRLDELTE
ncbi:MAG: protein kinase [Polyangiales bacterium]